MKNMKQKILITILSGLFLISCQQDVLDIEKQSNGSKRQCTNSH